MSIAVCAGIALLVCRLLFGKYIFTNWILLNLQTTTGIYTIVFLYILLPSIFKTAPILLLVLLNNIKIRKESEPPLIYKVIAYSGIIFYITAHLSLLRAGANLNYTYELTVILVLNLVLFIHLYKQKLLQNKMRNQLLFIAYIILLYIANIEVNNYAYDAAKEAELKKEYFQNIKERKEIQSIIKDSYTFFPNTKYSIYYTDKNIVLGHDMHLDRFIRLFTTIVYKSRLLFISTDKYDTDFKNGTIKYIITDNDKKNMEHVAEYYPHFKPYKIIGTKLIYQYNNLSIND